MAQKNSYFSKSLEKGLKILSLFNKEVPYLSQTEIATRLGMNMTSTFRYINTLVEMGYLDKDESTKQIRPSIFCLAFCNNLMRATNHLQLIEVMVNDLHSRYNMTIDVGMCIDDNMMRIYHREASETLTCRLPDFTKNCLHNTALGKAYLSSLPKDVLKEKVNTLQLTPKTEQTIVDTEVLMSELMSAKEKGYVLAVEEYLPGLIAIGAPLINPHNSKSIGAVSFDFSVLQKNATEIKTQYSEMIIDLANRISAIIPMDGQLGSR